MNYKFLIYISYSYSIPIGKPLEKEILSRDYEVRWFADESEGKSKLFNDPLLLNTIQSVVAYSPHIVLTATNVVPDFLKGLKVQIFHGFPAYKRPSKKIKSTDFKMRGFFDLYCTQGPSSTIEFQKLADYHKYFEVVETGWSKVDPLFPITDKKAAQIPMILICSTFTERLSLAHDDKMFETIERLSNYGTYKFMVTLHPKMNVDIIDKWKTLENKNLTYYDTTNLIPLFKKADIMLADTTSAIQEFLLQKRPVIAYKHTLNHDYLIQIDNVNELEIALDKALHPSKELLVNISKFANFTHPYKDGKSSARVINTSIDMLHRDKNYLKKKPLNLIRKFKIRKKTGFYSHKSYNKSYTINNREIKLTAIIPTGNEKRNIEAVIDSVSFADEVLVVDSYSSDGTYEIALQKADKVIKREYENSASQKNWAIPQASNEWILLVDADERVTPELQAEIEEVLSCSADNDMVAYWIFRKNHFMGKHVRFSGWQNDKVIRLFRRDKCRYENKMVHAEIIAEGKVGYLKNRLYHDTYTTIDNHIAKLNRYANWQAIDYDSFTGKLSIYHFFMKPLWSFFKHYIIQMGFLDGVVGFVISSLQAYSVFMRYTKLWLHRRDLK